jgi:sugar transferase (PEP-CTERM/EpsH1 system associated)
MEASALAGGECHRAFAGAQLGLMGRPKAVDDSRQDLLFLCHRIPFPPDKGDKIRSYHWLLALARHFRVHLAAFVDDEADWVHQEEIRGLCVSSLLLPLNSPRAKIRSLSGLLTGAPLSLPYYRDHRLGDWLAGLARSTLIRYVVVYSSAMAQYAAGIGFLHARRVIDFVDVDSDKWRQYADRRRGALRWIYRREASRLEAFDLDVARAFDVSLFVSAAEAAWFRERMGDGAGRVTHVDNGVDSAYFDPGLQLRSPYPPQFRPVVFTGSMDYWANADAVGWFVREVWPEIRKAEPRAVFYIVGARPGPEVKALAGADIVVTGRVSDVRPYLGHAAVVVAPMRIARGVQNKVLEGMAMARPVVVTSRALEGIAASDGREVLVADDAARFAELVVDILAAGGSPIGPAARSLVKSGYSWDQSCRRLLALVRGQNDAADNEADELSRCKQIP